MLLKKKRSNRPLESSPSQRKFFIWNRRDSYFVGLYCREVIAETPEDKTRRLVQ